jgi:2-methylcitrate dehydratase PrpD
MSSPLALQLADWVSQATFDDLPDDVVEATKLRILDVVGLALAGSGTAFGRSTRAAAVALSPRGPCHVFGTGEAVGPGTAAFTNAALAQALEFDDTHNESIVHMSSPSVAAALALSEARANQVQLAPSRATRASATLAEVVGGGGIPDATDDGPLAGRDLLLAIAIGNEISCRVGCVAPGQFHKRGLHPTALFAPFGVAYAAGKILGLDRDSLASAAGIAGSSAAGLLECWADGTQTKFLHSGSAAQSGITAALLAANGATGPARVFEGRFGLFASHLQDPAIPKDFDRLVGELGTRWESRNSSFKPYPAAHVLHPYLDALFRLRQEHGITAADVARIDCPVAAFIVGIVCEPVEEKAAPTSDAHCRVSLQHTLAEAMVFGSLGRNAYGDARRDHPEVRALATRVGYRVDPDYPGPGRFKGAVDVTLRDGRTLSFTQEYNRGSQENPMTYGELRAKFDDNASDLIEPDARDQLAEWIANAEHLGDASALVELSLADRLTA